MEAVTSTEYTHCKFARYKRIRIRVKDFDFLERYPKYGVITYDVSKTDEENRIMKLNILFGSSQPCKCKSCNPKKTYGEMV